MASVVLVDFVERSTVHTIQLGEELELWDRFGSRIRRIGRGSWKHKAGRHIGKDSEPFIQCTKPIRALVYRHEYTCNAEDIIRTVRSKAEVKQEQPVHIYRVGEDGGRYLETIPRQGQKNDRQVRP